MEKRKKAFIKSPDRILLQPAAGTQKICGHDRDPCGLDVDGKCVSGLLIKTQEDGFPTLFHRGTANLPDQAGIQKLLNDGGDGGFGKTKVFGKYRTGNGTFIDDGF